MKHCPVNPMHMCGRSSCVGAVCALEEHSERQRITDWWEMQRQPKGCICPPTSEQTCMSPTCPRRGVSTTTTGVQFLTEGKEGK